MLTNTTKLDKMPVRQKLLVKHEAWSVNQFKMANGIFLLKKTQKSFKQPQKN